MAEAEADGVSVRVPAAFVQELRTHLKGSRRASEADIVRGVLDDWLSRERYVADLKVKIEEGLADARAGRMIPIEQVREELLARFAVPKVA